MSEQLRHIGSIRTAPKQAGRDPVYTAPAPRAVPKERLDLLGEGAMLLIYCIDPAASDDQKTPGGTYA